MESVEIPEKQPSKPAVVDSDVKTVARLLADKQLQLWINSKPAVADVKNEYIKTAQTTALHRALKEVLEGTN